ncbi:uncharacterized protein LOC129791945 isoform X1 [Lutzomyia longipalpis]|uniref:uncharacterized protein LOC129791945 isoform X1 n=1 Tax=Lutzomyia longipalpis TaxID=7200 RepID=UPI0024836896|nr:uncharacterized protein LOC129791945 isoform X1 [Lutzomyia longipalpis]
MGTLMLIGVSALFVLTSAISVNAKDDASPMLDTIFCPFRPKPWDCTRQNVARMLSNWDEVLAMKLQEFKEEADAEYQAKLQSRDFTARDLPQEKPSAVMTTVEKTITSIAESVSERLEEFLRQPKSEDLEMEEKQIHKLGEEETDELSALDATENEAEGGTSQDLESGRYAGDQRGKKKKKKKALMKLLLLGAIVKGKIELLLKLLSAHLQLKFLAIAAIGLLVNIARFWIDLKKGHSPQKVIYYEHAQHQHHYDDHGDDWNGGGGYWKRSIEPGSVTAETEVHELPYRYQRPTSVYHQPQAPPYLY